MLERVPSHRVHSGKEGHRPKAIWFSANEQSMNHPIYRSPDTYVDISDVIDQKIEACLHTWNPWACSSEKLKEIGPPLLRAVGMEPHLHHRLRSSCCDGAGVCADASGPLGALTVPTR